MTVVGTAAPHAVAPTMGELRDMLHALHRTRQLEPVDVQLAELLVRRGELAGPPGAALALATAFASRARREGHSAVTLAQLVQHARAAARALAAARAATDGGALGPDEALRAHAADDADSARAGWATGDEGWWREQLSASEHVGDGSRPTVLVLQGDLLQFKRYHEAEQRIATFVRQRMATRTDGAVASFSIITGGPGTGKTSRVAQLLVELTERYPDVRIALAAPTGKAAARLTESIRQRMDRVARETGVRSPLPAEARTLHRLLGYSPQTDTFRSSGADPLDDDLVIVDEASMMDVLMLEALLRALKPGARLMLVGDHNQLASVDAGDVLGALCRSALLGEPGTPLRDAVTWLTTSWRFAEHPAIGTLAQAILDGDAEAVLAVCNDPAATDVQLRAAAPTTEALLEPVVPSLERCLAAESPHALLGALDAIRILAPEREGRMGVHGINAAVERWLARRGVATQEAWYHRRPVLVTANDYAAGVYNGDVGVVWRDPASGRVAVHFRTHEGTVRAIATSRLPAVETAWAMTVHKAQGSEFDHVLVVLPDGESRVMSRELLYTAVTRARRGVTVVASPSTVRLAVGRRTGRTSGLEDRLRDVLLPVSHPTAAGGAHDTAR